MAIVGDAYIVVHAITSGVEKDIQKAFTGMEGTASRAAQNITKSFSSKLNLGKNSGLEKLDNQLTSMFPKALKTSQAFHNLMRTGWTLQSAIGALAGSIGALVGGIGALGGAAVGAAPAIVALGGAFGALIVGMQVAKAAFGGIGAAIGSLSRGGGGGGANQEKAISDAMKNLALTVEANQKKIVDANNKIREAQLNLNEAFKQGKEEIQQLGFEAESAALSEEKAALELEKARATLAGVQDLPPNSRVRREAELAFQEADLNYRMAKDRATDLAKEQDRLSKTGVEGTQVVIDARAQLADAEQNLADTVVETARAQEDALNRLAEAQKGIGGGGIDPFAKLTESQKKFTLFLFNDVLPAMRTLKAAAADSFLPVLQEQMQRMMAGGLLDNLRKGIEQVSKGLAQATINFTDALLRETALENFSAFFTNSAKLIPKFGSIFGNTFAGVLALLDAASGLTEKFVGSVDSAMLRFRNKMELGNESGMLAGFFFRAGQLASEFGKIAGNIFGGFGALMRASVGPGSGGQMVVDWLQELTARFKNMDTFSLGIFLKGSTENMLAMLDTLGTFISALVSAGSNPAVKVFWDTISLGVGTFRHLVQESVKTAPVLAQVLLHLGEIIAMFSDSGSVIAFLNILQFVTGAFVGMVKIMQPLIDKFGPLLAVMSSLVVVGKAMKFANNVIIGSFQTMIGVIKNVIGFMKGDYLATLGQSIATKELTVSKNALNLAEMRLAVTQARLNVESAAAAAAAFAEADGSLAAVAAREAEAVATQALSVAEGELAVASGTAGAAMAAAFWPVTLVLAAVAVALAGVMIYMAIQQANFEKATGQVTTAMEGAADATDIYAASLLAIPDGRVKTFLADTSGGFEDMHYAIGQLGKAQSSFFGAMAHGTMLTTGLADAFGAIGKSLGNLAAEDLTKAQSQFKSFTTGMKLSREETNIALGEMDDYTTALKDQAAQLGINLLGQDGQIDKQKMVDFALGEGEIAIRRHTQAMLEQINATRDAALATISASDAYKAATTDIEGNTVDFNLEGFFTSLQSQIDAANQYVTNMTTVTKLGLNDQAVAFLNSMGADGQVALQAIADGGQEAVDIFNAKMDAMYAQTSQQTLLSSQVYGDAVRNIGEVYGDDVANAIATGIEKGTFTAEEAVNALGITVDGITPTLNVQADTSKVTSAIEAAIDAPKGSLGSLKVAAQEKPVVDVNTEAATGKVETLQEKLAKLNGSRYTSYLAIETEIKKKGGGYIGFSAWGNKDGGIQKLAAGGNVFGGLGPVYGAGGPRDDKVPAMLSAGEYVVNALATKRYLPLLNSINNGSPTFAQGKPGQGGGAPTINMTINPSPGMDEKALASMVSRELAFQMRKGSVY